MADDALVITGPTATGKTALSLDVAERIAGEIVSMDSRQVYRGMDIGTAKATSEERARAPHHLLDVVDPDQRFSAGEFARAARRLIAEIRARGRVPMLVGGTGFFLRALTHPLFREPDLPAGRRGALARSLETRDTPELGRWLAALDPALAASFASRGGGAGRQRLLRALEVALLTGRPLSWWQAHSPPAEPPLRLAVFVLIRPRAELLRRIDERVHDMVGQGLAAEVAGLLAKGYDTADPGMNATGYPEMAAHLRGELSIEQAIAETQRATRRYARRQLTWFRNQLPPDAVWLDATQPHDRLVEEVVSQWRRRTAA